MPFDAQPILVNSELQAKRRFYRDVPAPAPIDKSSVLAHLRAQLAELEASKEVVNGDA